MCILSPGRTITPRFLKITTCHILPLMAKQLPTFLPFSKIILTHTYSIHHLQITSPDHLLHLLNPDHLKTTRDHQETLIHPFPSHSAKYTDTSLV